MTPITTPVPHGDSPWLLLYGHYPIVIRHWCYPWLGHPSAARGSSKAHICFETQQGLGHVHTVQALSAEKGEAQQWAVANLGAVKPLGSLVG